MNPSEFTELIIQKGSELYRDMPWRDDTRPYYVLVSELMLQQTQVDRVVPKFLAFIEEYPSEKELAVATLAEVLTLWQGLGYNRRAKYLHDAAKMVMEEFQGVFPSTKAELLRLPGVGPNTAGAILNYAYNFPEPFIETNVRTVYFEHFFPDGDIITDTELRELVAQTLDYEHPREFYWALMDYGSWLKRQGRGRLAQSRHYKKQSPLKGSLREMRGAIIRDLTDGGLARERLLEKYSGDHRVESAIDGLVRDGLIAQRGGEIHLM